MTLREFIGKLIGRQTSGKIESGRRREHPQEFETHMFWARGPLSRLEHLSISSFVHFGYKVNIWTYGNLSNVPKKCAIRDAREILPENRLFLNKVGSYAGFSDLFRYAVLVQLGGLYSDTDVIANGMIEDTATPFLVTERLPPAGNSELTVNGNIIFQPSPSRGNIIDLAEAVADRYPIEKITWSEIGPHLLSTLVNYDKNHGFEIKRPEFANPIDYWNCPRLLFAPNVQVPEGAKFVHCYNEMWRRAGIDKNAPYPRDSLMELLENRFS